MAPEIHMPEPLCLIGSTEGHLVTNQEALKILSAITQPVVVVAIVGLYRTGKSYLMNKLAGKKFISLRDKSFLQTEKHFHHRPLLSGSPASSAPHSGIYKI